MKTTKQFVIGRINQLESQINNPEILDKKRIECKLEAYKEVSAGLQEDVIPKDEIEKQAWFIVTAMRSMNKDEIEMLCKNLLARYDIDLGRLVQHVNQIKDEKLADI